MRSTDITEYALQKLSESNIKDVFMVGRRGPCQAAFTIAELREMLKLPGVTTKWRQNDFKGIPEQVDKLQRPRKRLTELMIKSLNEMQEGDGNKNFRPIFYRSPIKINNSNDLIDSVDFSISKLINDQAVPTEEIETIGCKLVCRSIGYKSISVDESINFDLKFGRVKNQNGRVYKAKSDEFDYGLYVGGWLGSGPSGVILTTMNNAFNVSQTIIDDLKEGKIEIKNKPGLDPSKFNEIVKWDDWLKIDNEEIERGKRLNKCREKISSVKEMLNIL